MDKDALEIIKNATKLWPSVYTKLTLELSRYERLAVVAADVNECLKRSGLEGTAHQQAIAAALEAMKGK